MSKDSKTFVEKVLAFQKSDDASNVQNKVAAILKNWKKQIDIATRNITTLERNLAEKIDNLNEEIAEAKVALDEAYLNISTEQMNKSEREAYVSEYESQIADALAVVEDLEQQVKLNTKETTEAIEEAKKVIAANEAQIARLES